MADAAVVINDNAIPVKELFHIKQLCQVTNRLDSVVDHLLIWEMLKLHAINVL